MEEEDAVKEGCMVDHFVELQEVTDLITNLQNIFDNTLEMEISDEKFLKILDQYQEQPYLLDPHLEELLKLLLGYVKQGESPKKLIYCAFKYMYILTKVRGPKIMVRLFPHEVADLEPIMDMLSNQDLHDYDTWEMRYMLLLWLSMVCLIPFDMKRFDSTGESKSEKKPLMLRIIEIGKKSLINAVDTCQVSASLLLSKFFIRPDVYSKHTPAFIEWCLTSLSEHSISDMNGIMYIKGIMMVLTLLFKHGKRDDMIPYANVVLLKMQEDKFANCSNSLIKKYRIKLVQRLGTTFLKPKMAEWRYQRGSRSLEDTLKGNGKFEVEKMSSVDDEDEYEIPEEIESVIEILLIALRDGDTIVRWSAAKGVGRITGRLPKSLADEVVGSVLELFNDREDDNAWHGGCLTLAELGRRGLLLPRRLINVIPLLLKALKYDIKRGACSVGAHVRDSACYLAWSFARAYSPEILKPHVGKIAGGLLITTVFDREVNCRRAASAAFQENVGRQGQFPHGIDIVTTADYFAVGSRRNSYLNISQYIANFFEYTIPLIEHLVELKVNHWDPEIRNLTAETLHCLTKFNPRYMAETALNNLIPQCTGFDLVTRHGSIIAVAEIVHSLYLIEKQQPKHSGIISRHKSLKTILNICRKLWEEKLFRGFGGELMREANAKLITRLSQCSDLIVASKFNRESWLQLIHDNLSKLHTFTNSDEICSQTVAALAEVNNITVEASNFLSENQDSKDSDEAINQYIDMLSSDVERQRCGYSQVVGALPKRIVSKDFVKLRLALVNCSKISSPANVGFADARTSAINGLTSLYRTAGVVADGSPSQCICSENIHAVFQPYFDALSDYTTDKRGDVGSLVRSAAITGIKKTVMLILKSEQGLLDENLMKNVMTYIIQQACEKIHKVRDLAKDALLLFLHSSLEVPFIPHFDELKKIFPPTKFLYTNEFYQKLGRVLVLKTYSYSVLKGLIASIGDLTLSLSEASGQALCSHLENIASHKEQLTEFCTIFIKVFEDNSKSDRLSVPFLKTLQLILIKDYFLTLHTENRDGIGDVLYFFPEKIFDLVKTEIIGSGIPIKVLESIPVFCALIQFPYHKLRKNILFRLMIMLAHRFPIVRKNAASQLYEAVLVYEDLIDDPNNLDVVLTLLSETEWDQSLEQVRPVRNELCGYFSVSIPKKKVAGKS